jgi:hypothetical protein
MRSQLCSSVLFGLNDKRVREGCVDLQCVGRNSGGRRYGKSKGNAEDAGKAIEDRFRIHHYIYVCILPH